jgi:MFS family permease
VGALGSVQLIPLIVFGLWGGAFADAFDRRKLLVGAEAILCLGSLSLVINASLSHPSTVWIFVVSGLMSAANGFHRPALDGMTPQLVAREDLTAVAALNSFRGSIGMIAGPAISGMVLAALGLSATYLIDVLSFGVSLVALSMMRSLPVPEQTSRPGVSSILEGIKYAKSRPELIGTYLVDIVAMTFAMPMALFPAMAETWGGARAAGWLYSSMSIGSLIVTVFSGWSSQVKRHGAAVVIAAAIWGVAIIALGFSKSLPLAVVCLAFAGGADMVSGIFRSTIWNQTIPTHLRGRLSGLEMISYMTGPLLGNMRAGYLASAWGLEASIVSGGFLCVAGVLVCIPLLPGFWKYRAQS